MPESFIGQILGGCRIVEELARGGMSTIYLAEQLSLHREVALKVMSPQLLGDPTFMTRFTREVETTARLQHPHIIPIYDYGQQDGLPYIVMAYVGGGSLDQLLLRGPLSLDTAARLAYQIAQALDFAHEQGVIHRDIKPANVLLDSQQNAILSDFGIAKVVADTQEITKDALVGTPSYLAPELIAEKQAITPSADVYGLGVTIFQMLTATLPFPGKTPVQLMWAHVNEPAPLITSYRGDLPPAIDGVIQKALAKTPQARYRTAGELAQDLSAVAAGRSAAIAEASPPPPMVTAPTTAVRRLEDAVRRVIDQVVKILRPDGGTGAGLYLPDNHVLTCLHVVDGAPGVYVRFRTGEQIESDVVATDLALDLALLELRATPTTLTSPQLDRMAFEAHEYSLGEPLAAIGHPLGLNWAVTGGHFNGLRQPGEDPLPRFGITLNTPLVQVDVAINPGNSGGPLIDTSGRLVGIADSVVNPAFGENIGFAIDANTAYQFWQTHKDTMVPLVAYECGHHHAPETPYCPLTGKPTKPVAPIPMPPPDAVRFTCGHFHGPDTDYCPLTGRPAQPEEPLGSTHTGAPTVVEHPVKCTSCGLEFADGLLYCPHCGKPRQK